MNTSEEGGAERCQSWYSADPRCRGVRVCLLPQVEQLFHFKMSKYTPLNFENHVVHLNDIRNKPCAML